MKSKTKKHLNCEQIAPNAKNSYSDKVIVEISDITMTIRQAVLMFMLEKRAMFMTDMFLSKAAVFFWASIST